MILLTIVSAHHKYSALENLFPCRSARRLYWTSPTDDDFSSLTWYNPPFDMRVRTNLGKKFLRIVCECFPRGHALRPIFNRNTLKLSYSCMPNVKSTIDAHNKRLLKQTNSGEAISDARLCNCRRKEDCPLENQCLTKGIVYQAIVTTEQGSECYVGLTDTDLKSRFANHQQSFRNEVYSNQTELSKHVWQLKEA